MGQEVSKSPGFYQAPNEGHEHYFTWSNGSIWELVPGVDFPTGQAAKLRARLYKYARDNGYYFRTRIESGTGNLYVQAVDGLGNPLQPS